jgi:hypothetical protein
MLVRREEDYVVLLGHEFANRVKAKVHRSILPNAASFLSQKARACDG